MAYPWAIPPDDLNNPDGSFPGQSYFYHHGYGSLPSQLEDERVAFTNPTFQPYGESSKGTLTDADEISPADSCWNTLHHFDAVEQPRSLTIPPAAMGLSYEYDAISPGGNRSHLEQITLPVIPQPIAKPFVLPRMPVSHKDSYYRSDSAITFEPPLGQIPSDSITPTMLQVAEAASMSDSEGDVDDGNDDPTATTATTSHLFEPFPHFADSDIVLSAATSAALTPAAAAGRTKRGHESVATISLDEDEDADPEEGTRRLKRRKTTGSTHTFLPSATNTYHSAPPTRLRANTSADLSQSRSPSSSPHPLEAHTTSTSASTSKPPTNPHRRTQSQTAAEQPSAHLLANRRAATKCRAKKRAWVAHLQSQAEEVTARRDRLRREVAGFREEVFALKGLLLRHTHCGCERIRGYLGASGPAVGSGNGGGGGGGVDGGEGGGGGGGLVGFEDG